MDINNNPMSSSMSEKIYDNLSKPNCNLAWALSGESLLREYLPDEILENLVAVGKLAGDKSDPLLSLKPLGCLVRVKNGEKRFVKSLGSIGRYVEEGVIPTQKIAQENISSAKIPKTLKMEIKDTKATRKLFKKKKPPIEKKIKVQLQDLTSFSVTLENSTELIIKPNKEKDFQNNLIGDNIYLIERVIYCEKFEAECIFSKLRGEVDQSRSSAAPISATPSTVKSTEVLEMENLARVEDKMTDKVSEGDA